ncbi:peroxiredoxin-like family protein [Microvirga zambiensis]|uniref:peroxiredoxin-like family protein n=1 Tax=Microvirga zambiensis TaxID=1402137 RepID=UPI00191F3D3D|nr:peroxiredoxin-like family protein [Microvirga zambiensis]
MSPSNADTLNGRLAALHAERVATWAPEDLAINVNQRSLLAKTINRANIVKPGDSVEPFELLDVEGGRLSLDELVASGPVVLIFFRFAGCPACNIALPYYEQRLARPLADLGVRLVAVSPQVPERLVEIKRAHGLSFDVASDRDAGLARRFNVLYTYDEASQKAALAKGRPIGDVTGTGTWELPMPAVIVIDEERTVRFAEVSPDWLVRTEAEAIVDVVAGLAAQRNLVTQS